MKRIPLKALLLWSLLALLTIAATFILIDRVTAPGDQPYTFNQVRLLTNAALREAEAHFHEIDSPAFATRIEPHLPQASGLEIIDTAGKVRFATGAGSDVDQTVDLRAYLHYDAAFDAANDDMVKFAFPLVVEGIQVGNALFYLPEALVLPETAGRNDYLPLLPLLLLIIIVFLAIIFHHHRFQRRFLQPLAQLNAAVNKIARGNLDEKILFQEGNELAALSQSVDVMRLELKDLLARQAEHEKARKELITKISHDLNTPLASIKAYVEGLQSGIAADPATRDKYLAVIGRKADSLATLVDDLLQHSLQELGQLRIHKQEQYSRELLESIIAPLTVQFADSDISFDVQGELPDVLVNVDATRLEQVIVNLVHNAKKYTAAGGEITFTAENEAEFLRISVQDTGAGVPASDMPHIFNDFYRSSQVARDFEGAGLGLAICKYIVEAHGGRIWVESKLNEGSTFTFTIAKA